MRSIHFPLQKNAVTQLRQPDTDGLIGEAASAAEMIKCAIVDREFAFHAAHLGDARTSARYRARMREMALRARAYARQIPPDDQRLASREEMM